MVRTDLVGVQDKVKLTVVPTLTRYLRAAVLTVLVVAFGILGVRAVRFWGPPLPLRGNPLTTIARVIGFGPLHPLHVDWLRGLIGLGLGAMVGVVFGFGLLWILERIRQTHAVKPTSN
jgi:hypothetical protein